MDSVLAVSLQGVGNLVLATPVLKELAASGKRVHLLARSRPLAEMLEPAGWMDGVSWLAGGGPGLLAAGLRLRSRRFDASVTFFPDGRKAAIVAVLAGAPVRAGFTTVLPSWLRSAYTVALGADGGVHDVVQNARLLDVLGVARPGKFIPSIPVTDADRRFAAALLDQYGLEGANRIVAIHPGGRARVTARRWEFGRYKELASRFTRELGVDVLFVGDEAEKPMLESAADAVAGRTAVLAGESTLRESAAVIARCALFVGNDSGPLHIAAAVGTPVVGIYGPTDARRTAPYGVAHEVIVADIDCRPCYEFGVEFSCRLRSAACLEAIGVGRVFDSAARLLEEPGGRE